MKIHLLNAGLLCSAEKEFKTSHIFLLVENEKIGANVLPHMYYIYVYINVYLYVYVCKHMYMYMFMYV